MRYTLLREDPYLHSESRSGSVRILLVPPLGVDFKVLEDDRLVKVASVWKIRTR